MASPVGARHDVDSVSVDAMLDAAHVNCVLEAFLTSIEERLPKASPLSLGEHELVQTPGSFGSVILSQVFFGELEGKLTLLLEWETAFRIAEELTGQKIEFYDEVAQNALEKLFSQCGARLSESLSKQNLKVECMPLPTLIDTNVLLGISHEAEILRVSIRSPWGDLSLHLAFEQKHEEEARGASA